MNTTPIYSEESLTKKVITVYDFPPIPVRYFDWCAYFEGEEEEGFARGHGRTEADAIQELFEMSVVFE